MIRLIKENAVTDLRNILKNEVDFSSYPIADKKTGDFERTWKKGSRSMYGYRGKFIEKDEKTVDALMKWLSDILLDKYLGFNLNDLKITKIGKPSGSTKAKKNPNYLIGISTDSGNAALIGKGEFFEYFSGLMGRGSSDRDSSSGVPEDPVPTYDMKHARVSFRDLWDTLDLWFEIAPEDETTYRTRSEIRKAENRDYYSKLIAQVQRDLYDVDYAREKYAKRLRVVKDRKKYESLLNQIEDVNERIRSIEFGHPIFGVGGKDFDNHDVESLRRAYNTVKYRLEGLSKAIEWSDTQDMEYQSSWLEKAYRELDDILTKVFKV